MTWRSLRALAALPTAALVFIGVTASVSLTSCVSMDDRFPIESSQPKTAQEVASAALLTELMWQPLNIYEGTEGADIKSLDIVDGTIFALDSMNTVHAISAKDGTHQWVLNLDHTPDHDIIVTADQVGFLSRNHLTVVSRSSGSRRLMANLSFTPSSNGALAGDTFYAGAYGGGTKLRSVSLLDGWNGWSFNTNEAVVSAPVVAGQGASKRLYFTTDGGLVACTAPRAATAASPGKPDWTYHTLGPNSADLVADDSSVYVASEDRALYALTRTTGGVRWKWFSNFPLVVTPSVGADTVYQTLPDGVVAIAKDSGETKYTCANATAFVTRIGDRDYFRNADNTIFVVDAHSGEQLSTFGSNMLTLVPTNTEGGAFIFSDGRHIFSVK